MAGASCPSRADLAAYHRGALADDAMTAVEAHLEEGCPRCDDVLRELESGKHPTLDLLRQYAAAGAAPARLAGRYELGEEIGSGGMGTVFRAHDAELDRVVAVKMIRGGPAITAELRERFTQEARALAGLEHPNIVRLYDYGVHDGLPFFVLELVDGESLDRAVRRHLPAPAVAAERAEHLARALHYAHERGVIHRDVKPANVLIARGGTPKLMDFGLAKRLALDAGQTRTGVVMGTPSYMPPEQASGLAREAGPAADVYSLGATLYAMLTGRAPFGDGDDTDILEQVRRREPVAPSQLRPRLPRDLQTICLKCLEKAPGDRYGDAAALADDLGRFRRGESIRARRARWPRRAEKWVRRNPAPAAFMALLTLGLAVVSGLLLWVDTARQAERTARAAAEAAGRAAQGRLYLQAVGRAGGEYRNNRLDLMRAALDTAPAERRGWEWHYLDRLCSGQAAASYPVEATGLACSPDGRFIAASAADAVRILDAADGRPRAARAGRLAAFDAWTAGRALLRDETADPPSLLVWDFLHDVVRHRLPVPAQATAAAAVDGARLAIGTRDGTVELHDAASGKLPRTLGHGRPGPVTAAAFSPDGRRLASVADDAVIHLWDTATGERLARLAGHQRQVFHLAFHPCRPWLASATASIPGVAPRDGAKPGVDERFDNHCDVRLWDLAAGAELLRLPSQPGTINRIAFAPEGDELAVAGSNRKVERWRIDPATHQASLAATHRCPQPVVDFAFGPGATLVSIANDVQRWDLRRRPEPYRATDYLGYAYFGVAVRPTDGLIATVSGDCRIALRAADGAPRPGWLGPDRGWRAHDHVVFVLAFSPDGTTLASGSADRTVKLWDVRAAGPGAAPRRVLEGPTDRVRALAFSPDGTLLAAACNDGLVRVWEVGRPTAGPRWVTGRHPGIPGAVAFTDDGQTLVTADEGEAARGGAVLFWELPPPPGTTTLRERGRYTGLGVPITGLSFGPGGRLAVAAGHVVEVWDTRAGRRVATCRGHGHHVRAVAFHPDGTRLASASHDKTVRLWDAETGEELLTLTDHPGAVSGIAFGPGGHRLVGVGWHHTLVVWDGTPRDAAPRRPQAGG